ncbi:MAG: gfo/Idh/MocA family oxidoreductase [Acidobacteria bacterium]|nr:MAG: gfo/Idh/MocA family oxidoreductase [Acidobacteriota bacterium]
MKAGIIGTGAVAGHHARAIAQTDGVELAAVASRTREKAEQMAARYGARCYPDAASLIDDRSIELVIICTFPDSHCEYAVAAARRGKHVLVEKPIDLSLQRARQTIEECRKAGVTLAVVSQRRFCDGPRHLHEAVRSGKLGKILQADAYVKWYRTPAYYAVPGKGTWEVEGGGALINQTIHQIDLLRWIIGPVRHLTCEWQLGCLHAIPSEDVAAALLRYDNEATGVIQASTAFFPGFPDRIEIHGTKGSVTTEGDFLKQWDVPGCPPPPSEAFQSGTLGSSKPMDIPVEPFCRQLRDVMGAISSGKPPLVTGQEGLETLKVVLAMYDSARSGNRIAMERG